eukprot:XP_027304686.1 verprolin-like [Anas platyrhynchos]
MPKEQEAKACSQPNKGLPSMKKHHQVQPKPPQAGPLCSQTPSLSIHGVRLPQLHCPQKSQASRKKSTQTDSLKLRQALPGSSATGERRDPLPALPPLPRQAATLRTTHRHSVGASTIPRLPSLSVAGSTSSVPCRDCITSTKAVRLPEVVPRPQGHEKRANGSNCREPGDSPASPRIHSGASAGQTPARQQANPKPCCSQEPKTQGAAEGTKALRPSQQCGNTCKDSPGAGHQD